MPCSAYEESAVIGLRTADGVRLNPPMETLIQPGDKVIAISADDDTVKLAAHADAEELTTALEMDTGLIRTGVRVSPSPERTLILGWNRRATAIVGSFDDYVAPGSSVQIVASDPPSEALMASLGRRLSNQTISAMRADTTDRAVLDDIGVSGFDQVIVLPYSDRLAIQEADAQTLITLLHLRDMAQQDGSDVRLVTEMLDLRNRELAEVTQVDDFIVSSRLTSLLLAQVSENKELTAVFADLLDPEGSEIYLKPVELYLALGESMNFYTVVEAARRRGEIAIGYRRAKLGSVAAQNYGVALNPRKSERVVFAAGDSLIVVAED